jgi:hypothetical protein
MLSGRHKLRTAALCCNNRAACIINTSSASAAVRPVLSLTSPKTQNNTSANGGSLGVRDKTVPSLETNRTSFLWIQSLRASNWDPWLLGKKGKVRWVKNYVINVPSGKTWHSVCSDTQQQRLPPDTQAVGIIADPSQSLPSILIANLSYEL